ncbi:hypothetical protein SDC9_150603 [bioreactor metagenome]|uniref:DUF3842 family protein n=1 Tax=bioreactor metagenome TaxID=1076179 RepID=A0A645ES91_9ZZZZ|nr:DUF3842 family protein [Oscillospiraceae bacterium]
MNKNFCITVIDGQGGKIGRELVERIKIRLPEAEITAIGTNTVATAAMMKAGADFAATGENAVKVAARKTDVIIGPIGIIIADALLGEITPDGAVSVAQSKAKKILIPINKCGVTVAGIGAAQLSDLINSAVDEAASLFSENKQ